MRKLLVAVVLVGALMLFTAAPARAGNFIGEFCWGLSPFIDTLKLSVSSGGKQYEAHGSWAAAGAYEMAAVGSAFIRGDGKIEFGIDAVNYWATMFADAHSVVLRAVLSASTLSGPWTLSGVDKVFTNSGTLTPKACPSGPTEPEALGAAAGQ